MSIKPDKIKRYQTTERVKNNCHIPDSLQVSSEENKKPKGGTSQTLQISGVVLGAP